jgi:putative two-component system response regulator
MNRNLLLVDDESNVLSSLKRHLRKEGYTIYSANSAKAGLDLMKDHHVGVVLTDNMMPEMDGVAFLEAVKQQAPDVVRILMTGYASLENAMAAINRSQIFAYLTKPWEPEILKGTIASAFEHYNLTIENRRLQKLTRDQNAQLKLINESLDHLVHERTSQLEDAVREGIVMLAMAAEAKDDDTGHHVHRIQDLTRDICIGLGLSPEESEQISFSSIMHDVGKINIPDNILKKAGSLTDEEWTVMKTHTIAAEKILGEKPFYQTAREIARSHHERWDGSGYPDGLKGESIPLAARIVTIADVFDALTHSRPYKKAWPAEKALAEMKRLADKAFDPDILEVFLKLPR